MTRLASIGLATTLVVVGAAPPARAAAAQLVNFAPAQYLATGSTATNAVAVADVTGDGRADT
ncbi:hypothetical protein [Micromonospora zingiberis]|uniref:hypothetical protein n=1 Tax=Micromonospora zingiberis TaxID=2053011 RepID=UPI001F104491|nr:hypothetical protein [Micromonospora zingiberis]